MKKAMKKIKTSLTNNVSLKIVAVIIAAIVWLAVVNINDPERTVVIYNVPVTITNEEAITDMNMVYYVESDQYIDITVSGKRSMVSSLSADDFKVTASLKEMSKVHAIPIEITPKNKSIGRKITIVKQSQQMLNVSVEDIEKSKYNIEVEFGGTQTKGYAAANYSLSNDTVEVKAPTSTLDRIARVVATCNLDGQSKDFEQKCKLVLFDKRGNQIQGKNIELSIQKVTVSVNMQKKKEVPVIVETAGEPALGYQMDDTVLSMEKVTLVGSEDAIDNIESLNVDKAIDISNASKNIVTKIDLSEYLPEGVSIDGDKTLTVTIGISKMSTRTISIDTSDITVQNQDENLQLSFPAKSIKVEFRGDKSVLGDINPTDLNPSIDLSNCKKGTTNLPVSIDVPEGTELVEEITVKIKLK